MKRIVLAIVILSILISSLISSILSFQARERNLSSIEGTPPIELIDGIRITTSSFSSNYLSFRLTKEQVEEVKERLNDARVYKHNFSTRKQIIHDSFISFSIDIMANKTAYKMTVHNNLEVVIGREDTYFLTDSDLVRLLFDYSIEQIGYNEEE